MSLREILGSGGLSLIAKPLDPDTLLAVHKAFEEGDRKKLGPMARGNVAALLPDAVYYQDGQPIPYKTIAKYCKRLERSGCIHRVASTPHKEERWEFSSVRGESGAV